MLPVARANKNSRTRVLDPLLAVMIGLALAASCTRTFASEFSAVVRDLPWRSLGPDRGGRVTTVTGVRGYPWRFFAGTAGGGVLRSDDAGQTWRSLDSHAFGSASVGAIAVAPSAASVIYVGMGESTYRSYMSSLGDGVYKSVDGGNTWTDVGLHESLRIGAIAVDPQNPEVAYVAAMGNPWAPSETRGLYKTLDGGLHWDRTLFVNDTTSVVDISIDPADRNTLYASTWDNLRSPWYLRSAGSGSGLFKSRDGGRTWARLSVGLPKKLGKVAVAVSPADPRRVYALVESTPEAGGLYVSDDRGEHWQRINGADYLWNRAWYYMELTPDPRQRDRLWIMCTDLWRSDDGGAHFSRVETPHGDNHALWIDPEDSRIIVEGNDGGATVTLDGGATWSSQFNQRTGQFYRVSVDALIPYDVLGAQQDWGTVSVRSRDDLGGGTPDVGYDLGGNEAGYVVADPFEPNIVYAGGELGLLTRFDRRTGLKTPIMAYPRFPEGIAPRDLEYRFDVNAPLVASVHTPGTIYHAAQKVLRSRDRGQDWEAVSPDLTRDDPSKQGLAGGPFTNERIDAYDVISTLSESPLDARILWAGTDDGRLQVTIDGCKSWRDVTPPGVSDGLFYTVSASPITRGAAFAVLSRHELGDPRPYLFATEDFGRTWKNIASDLPRTTFARVLRQDPVRSNLLYAGTEQGAFVSVDSGGSWSRLGHGLPLTPVTDLKVVGDDLVIATEGRGFWILSGLGTLRQSAEESPELGASRLFSPPVAYITEGTPSSPDEEDEGPANAGVYVDAFIDAEDGRTPGAIRLQVFDASGRLVRTLHPELGGQDPGTVAKGGRFVRTQWDLRRDSPSARIAGTVDGTLPAFHIAPGRYRVRLQTASASHDTILDARLVPSGPQPSSHELAEKEQLLERIETTFVDVANTVNAEAARRTALVNQGRTREAAELMAWERRIFDRRLTDSQARVNYGGGLLFDLVTLSRYIDGSSAPVPPAMPRMCGELEKRWQMLRAGMP